MKLVPVTGKPFTYTCVKCGVKGCTDNPSGVYADVEGKPFESYYCAVCANVMKAKGEAK